MSSVLKIGLFGIGLDTYWDQFKGLKERLEGYLQEIHDQLAAIHPHIVNAGLVDNADKAFAAGSLLRRSEVDLIFLYVSTYALSSTVLPVVQRAKVPVIILNLSPAAAIDYEAFNAMTDRTAMDNGAPIPDRTAMTGEWLAFCSACPVPEIANVFSRVGIRFHQVTGMLRDDAVAAQEIREWVEAAKVMHTMANNRLGCMGHYYSGMLDIYTDLTQQYASFGGHIELIEVEELAFRRRAVDPAAVEQRVRLFYDVFDVDPDCPAAELQKAAVTALALDRLVERLWDWDPWRIIIRGRVTPTMKQQSAQLSCPILY